MITIYPRSRRSRARERAEAIDRVVVSVASWPGVSTAPHQFDAIEFQIDGVEFGHLNSNGVLDVPFVRRIRNALVDAGSATVHRWVRNSGWVSFEIRSGGDADKAIYLLRLSYLYRTISVVRSAGEDDGLEAMRRELDEMDLPCRLFEAYDDLLSGASAAFTPDA